VADQLANRMHDLVEQVGVAAGPMTDRSTPPARS
jgi:hypothetical protein